MSKNKEITAKRLAMDAVLIALYVALSMLAIVLGGFKLTFEQACACVGYMDSIKDSLIWIAFIEADDGFIRVRLRSRFVTVNEVAEKYNGGGHDCASGATVHSRKEMKALIADADTRLAHYKESNEGWL